MNINDVLTGSVSNLSVDEQKEVLAQMKERKIFDLSNNEKENLISFLCDEAESELSVDYLFHVLDNEISYPMDDEKVKSLFSDDRMRKMKDLMMATLDGEDSEENSEENSEEDPDDSEEK